MLSSWTKLKRLLSGTSKRRSAVRRRPTTRPYLERLEDRVVPTVAYEPVYGAESMSYQGGPVLNDAPVYLLFWGSYWNTTTGSTTASSLTTAISNELNSPVFSHLSQYKDSSGRTAGPAYIEGSWIATEDADPTNGFSDSALQKVVSDAISDQYSPILSPEGIEPEDGGRPPMYFVITPPDIHSAKGSNVFGYHSNYSDSSVSTESLVYGWGGTDLVSSYDTQDNTTLIASHEIGEALTDPYIRTNAAWQTKAGANWPYGGSPDEIGDFEPEYEPSNDTSYSYRLNGSLVQALWDQNAGNFTVPDGNTQTFFVVPQYSDYNYIGNMLAIYGDQYGNGYNNNITIATAPNGGVYVDLNGETVTFDPGQITSLYVYTGSGTDNVSILSTPSGMSTYINGGGSDDTVTIGNYAGSQDNGYGFVGGINGSIDVYGDGTMQVNVDDSGDGSSQNVTMKDGEIDYGSAAPILYTPTANLTGGVVALNVFGGSGGNSFYVNQTSNFHDSTWLKTGSGNDSVFVDATMGALYNYNPGGSDFTELFVGNLNGLVDAYGPGSTSLEVNAYNDSTARTVSMYDGSLYGMGSGGIFWTPSSASTGGVTSLAVTGGSGGNTFNVYNTSNFSYKTEIDTGSGGDSVNVHATTGELDIWTLRGSSSVDVGEGNMIGINGSVYLGQALSTATYLTLDDHNDTTGRTAYLYDGEVTGLSPAPISWMRPDYSDGVQDLYVYGGTGGNTFNIESTSAFAYYTDIDTGTGSDTVNVFATTGGLYVYNPGGQDYTYVGLGYTGNLNGFVNAYGPGSTYLYLNDSNDTTGRTVSMNDGSITGLSPATISWSPTSTSTGGVTYLEVDGGSGGDTFNVTQTSNIYLDTALNPGGGNDDVTVANTKGGLFIVNPGGADVTEVGLGSVATINGYVETETSGSGTTTLEVNDSGDTTNRTVSVSSLTVEGLGNSGGITYNSPLFGSGKVSLTLDGGSGGNTYNIDSTSGTTVTLNSGTGFNYVYVNATSAPLNINNAGGADVFIGNGDMSGIDGAVDVYGTGSTSLFLYDYNDTTSRTVTMNDGSVTGLAPAAIEWTPSSSSTGGVTYFELDGSSVGSTYNIKNTSKFYNHIYFQTGGGNDVINIYANQGELYEFNAGGVDSVNVGVGSLAHINGWVEVSGIGKNAMTVDDHLDTTARNATLTSSQLAGLGNAGTIYYDSTANSLTVKGSSKGSTYNIQSTSSSTPVTLTGGGGNDIFNVGDGSNTLNGIQGVLTIKGGSGTNTFNIHDQGSASGQSYTLFATHTPTLTTNTLTRSGAAAITYAALAHVNINASNGGNDSLTLKTPVPTIATIFIGGTGTNTLQGANVANTWTISGDNQGKLNSVSFSNFQYLVGGTASDTFKFTTSTASISNTISGGGSGNKLDYSLVPTQMISVTLSSATAGNATRIGGGFSGINSVVGNSNTGNTLTGPNAADNLWTISGVNKGTLNVGSTIFTFSNMPNLVGGTNVDIFKFSGTAAKETTITGGGAPTHQGDWLDYSAFGSTTTVAVNLATGSATNVSGGVSGIQNVIGGKGTNTLTGDAQGNILIGGNGANTIVGGSGNSLLIGGSGHGSIAGGSGQDILIAGTTTYGLSTNAGKNSLMAILAEMQSSDTFAQKVSDLIHGNSGGGGSDLNGGNKLAWGISGATVKASSGSFALQGDSATETTADWFFANAASTVSDFDDDGVNDEHDNNAIGTF